MTHLLSIEFPKIDRSMIVAAPNPSPTSRGYEAEFSEHKPSMMSPRAGDAFTHAQAHSQAWSGRALDAYLHLIDTIGHSRIQHRLRDQIQAYINGLGSQLIAESDEPKVQAAFDLTQALIETHGWVHDATLEQAIDSGFTPDEVAEIVAIVTRSHIQTQPA